MSTYVDPGEQADFPLVQRVTAALVAGGATLAMMTACSGETAPAPEPTATHQAEALGPCKEAPTGLGDAILRQHAQACEDFLERGSVALVTYPGSGLDANKIAAGMQSGFRTASEGLVNVTVTVVPASADAQAKLAKVTPGGCVDSFDASAYPSRVASQTMTELSGYGEVIGLTDMKDCSGQLRGVADNFSNRYAEIFGGALGNDIDFTTKEDEAVKAGTHEGFQS